MQCSDGKVQYSIIRFSDVVEQYRVMQFCGAKVLLGIVQCCYVKAECSNAKSGIASVV